MQQDVPAKYQTGEGKNKSENMNQTMSQRSKMSTLDQTKKKKKKEEFIQPPWCSNVKKDTKNKLYSKMKHKLEDVSIVLGFNTARGD